jgi:hypothetical protein
MSREERRSRRDRSAGQQVSTTTTNIHHTTSPPIPPSSLAREGGCNPTAPLSTSCRPTAARNRAMAARFRFLDPNPLPASRFANTRPHHHHHHLALAHATTLPLRTILRCRFTRRARNRATAAWFRGFGPNPLPASRFTNARPHHHHHLAHASMPPLRTVPHCRFTRRA